MFKTENSLKVRGYVFSDDADDEDIESQYISEPDNYEVFERKQL